MASKLATDHVFLLSTLSGYLDGDALAKIVFESAEFREAIHAQSDKILEGVKASLGEDGKVNSDELPGDDPYHSMIVTIINEYFNENSFARALLKSAEFRGAIRHRLRAYQEGGEADLAFDPSNFPPMELIVTGKNSGRHAFKEIKRWLKGASNVTICDPYIFHVPNSGYKIFSSEDDYIRSVASLIPSSCTRVKFYGNGFTSRIRSELIRILKEGRRVDFVDSNIVHDRYIIKDGAECRQVGTSFGGFGRKVFSVVDLSPSDTSALVDVLVKVERGDPLPD